jgi:hypothetical protein
LRGNGFVPLPLHGQQPGGVSLHVGVGGFGLRFGLVGAGNGERQGYGGASRDVEGVPQRGAAPFARGLIFTIATATRLVRCGGLGCAELYEPRVEAIFGDPGPGGFVPGGKVAGVAHVGAFAEPGGPQVAEAGEREVDPFGLLPFVDKAVFHHHSLPGVGHELETLHPQAGGRSRVYVLAGEG